MNDLMARLRAVASETATSAAADSELLSSYAMYRDPAAFESLVRRHGPMVLATCRRVVGNVHDAEDAFQATFLVLARKSDSIRPRSALAGWLHGVALRAAHKVRVSEARRQARERKVATMPKSTDDGNAADPELLRALHREITRLPMDLRAAIVVCELEGKTRAAAARQLRWPEGTVASRLTRARQLLARRLKVAELAAIASPLVPIAVPERLVARTLNSATQFASGPGLAGSVAVVAAEEMVMDMLVKKLTSMAAATFVVAAAIAVTVFGVGTGAAPTAAAPLPKPGSKESDLAAMLKTARPLTPGLLEQDEVLNDMKCSPEQRQAMAEILKAARDEQREALQRMLRARVPAAGPAPPGGVAVVGGAGFSISGRLNIDSNKLLAPLKPEQIIRARQIELQLKGPQAFADRRVVRALGLTVEQEEKVEEILVKFEAESMLPTMVAGGNQADFKPLAEQHAKVGGECLKLLTKEQKASWDRLIGPVLEPGPWLRSGFGQSTAIAGGMALPAIREVGIPLPPAAPPIKR
jgi:RNA polymerase sigma factor (sigma-70 family)